MDTFAPTHDSIRAKVARKARPGYSYCFRCGFPWDIVKAHVTNYTLSGGCFPLCEGCWETLGSPEARIEYYKMLIDHWEQTGDPVSDDTKRDIQKAVANGR